MSFRDEIEVLEMGEDGAFDIPSPEKMKKSAPLPDASYFPSSADKASHHPNPLHIMSAFASVNATKINGDGPIAFEASGICATLQTSLGDKSEVVSNGALETIKNLAEGWGLFIAASKFEGNMPGYSFKTGSFDTGYYFDPTQGVSMKRKVPRMDYKALRNGIRPGEYRVFQEETAMIVLLRTSSVDEKVKEIKLNDVNNFYSNVIISIESADSYSVDIPNVIEVSSQGSTAKIWEDFVSIRIPVNI